MSTPPLSMRPHALGPVLRQLRAGLGPSVVVPLRRSNAEEPQAQLDLLAHTPDCGGPISEPPPARRGRGERR